MGIQLSKVRIKVLKPFIDGTLRKAGDEYDADPELASKLVVLQKAEYFGKKSTKSVTSNS
jgi:hypothetical protein